MILLSMILSNLFQTSGAHRDDAKAITTPPRPTTCPPKKMILSSIILSQSA